MSSVILISIAFGVIWNVLGILLVLGDLSFALSTESILAGAVAGVVAGVFTVWSRKRHEGEENVFHVIVTYYIGVYSYWISLMMMNLIESDLSDFKVLEFLHSLFQVFMYSTVWVGFVLIPLCFLTRHIVWKVYAQKAA